MVEILENPMNKIHKNNDDQDEETILSSVPSSAIELISQELWSKLPLQTRKMIYLQMVEAQMVS
jgi:hypothetical protein